MAGRGVKPRRAVPARGAVGGRRRKGDDRAAYAGSAVIHSVVFLGIWLSSAIEPEPMEFVTFQFELVAPPAPEQPEEEPPAQEEELVVETPEPPPPEPEPEPIVEEDPEPEELQAETPEPPAPDPSTPEEIEVRMEGLKRDFPAYYGNIVAQIDRCFRPGSHRGRETVVYFIIQRDGTVSGEDVVEGSGNFEYDVLALEAVECAGKRFGPLPEDLPYDRLPVRFRIETRGQGSSDPLLTPDSGNRQRR